MPIVVIGVGSAHGDDGAGPALAERLARGGLPAQVRVLACTRPVPDLLEAFAIADAVLLVDATRSGRAPGTVWRPEPASLRRNSTASTHGLGVAQALDLASALGRAPRRLALVGIEVASSGPGAAASPAVDEALPEAERVVRDILSDWIESSARQAPPG